MLAGLFNEIKMDAMLTELYRRYFSMVTTLNSLVSYTEQETSAEQERLLYGLQEKISLIEDLIEARTNQLKAGR